MNICERTETFAVNAVAVFRQLKQHDAAARLMGSQFLRSAMSIGANVEEAQGAESRRDFRHKYAIARKEVREVRYWLRLLSRTESLRRHQVDPLLTEASELYAILTTIIKRAEERRPQKS